MDKQRFQNRRRKRADKLTERASHKEAQDVKFVMILSHAGADKSGKHTVTTETVTPQKRRSVL